MIWGSGAKPILMRFELERADQSLRRLRWRQRADSGRGKGRPVRDAVAIQEGAGVVRRDADVPGSIRVGPVRRPGLIFCEGVPAALSVGPIAVRRQARDDNVPGVDRVEPGAHGRPGREAGRWIGLRHRVGARHISDGRADPRDGMAPRNWCRRSRNGAGQEENAGDDRKPRQHSQSPA